MNSITMRLALTLLFSITLMCAVTTYSAYSLAQTRRVHTLNTLANNYLQRIDERISGFFDPGLEEIHELAKSYFVRNSRGKLPSYLDAKAPLSFTYGQYTFVQKRLYNELSQALKKQSFYRWVAIGNDDGQYLQTPDGVAMPAHYDPRSQPWWREAATDARDIMITSPWLTTAGESVCAVTAKTFDLNNQPLGLIAINYDLVKIIENFAAMRILETGYVVIFAPDGRLVFDGRHPEYTALNPDQYPQWRRKIRDARDGVTQGGGAREEEYAITNTNPLTGWKIAVIFDEDEVFTLAKELLDLMLIEVGAGLMLTIMLTFYLSRRIMRPLLRLTETTRLITADNAQISSSVEIKMRETLRLARDRETRQLANAMITMTSTLQERATAATAANQAKSAFLSQMSHEIRTPLNVIVGMTAIARDTPAAERKDYYLEKISAASDHLLGVINNILDLSKIEAGKFTLGETDFALDEVARKVENVAEFRASEKSQTYVMRFAENLPPVWRGDGQRLTQVLINLLTNAVKFTPKNGKISLDAELLDETDAEFSVKFRVTDTGIGLNDEQQARLFQPFSQANRNTAVKFGGTGLGLAICKFIVEMMNGNVGVISAPNAGSTFWFTGKFRRGSATVETPADEGEDYDFSAYRILLVDDLELNREVAAALLEKTGVMLDEAANGYEAIDKFSAEPRKYHLILMDVYMPELDGYAATRQIRALPHERAREVPIIAMTASVFREDIERCLASGMNAHLGKPLITEELFRTLSRYLRGQ